MSNETPDDLAAWRRLLREPDTLPGQGLADKDAAWDKLFERLNARPRRRLSGYRIAAACLLVLLIPATRIFRERPAPPKGIPVAEKVRPMVPVAHGPVDVPPVPSPAIAAVGPKKTNPAPIPREKRGGAPKVQLPPAPAVSTEPIATVPQMASISTGQPETPNPPPARPSKPAPKKQWRVVDINELEPGHDRPQGMVADRQFRPLRLGIGASEIMPARREEDSRLKINLTTQNH